MLFPDLRREPRYVKMVEAARCKAAAPMVSRGQVIGALDIDSETPGAYGEADLERLVRVADEATRALESVWRERQLASQSEQLNALFEVGQRIVSSLELQSLWDTIAEAALELTGSRMSTLQRYDKERGLLRLLAARPRDEEFERRASSIRPNESLAGSAIRTRRQIEATNISTRDYIDLADRPSEADVVSCLSTPMIIEGAVIGAINIFTRKRHRFANSEKRLLQAFASLSAVAAQNADLYARVLASEERLRKSDRLTTLGLLSAEIAHEIRNPLTVIKLLFGSLGLEYEPGDPRATDARIIREKLDNLEETVARVLSFGKAPQSLSASWSVDELLEDTCLLVRHKMRQQNIQLERRPLRPPSEVSGNKGQLQQVFLNLILNAAEAMPEGGSLAIAPALAEERGRPMVAIDFEDTGAGIPPDMLDKLFDSFLTNKDQGAGLGLALVKRILKQHKGDIAVAATGPKGTTMRVLLPKA